MSLREGPFKSFQGTWFFKVVSLEKTRVSYTMEYQISNPITDLLLKKKLDSFIDQFVGEFVKKFKE
jgi:ribosome-associated toxin RatA of RatAB toxin-antitoxin module